MLDASQETAKDKILEWFSKNRNGHFSMAGIGGSGKSFVLAEHILPEIAVSRGLRVAVTTPTAKASRVIATRLSDETKAQLVHLGTIHSLIYYPELDWQGNIVRWVKKRRLDGIDLIVVDECSMVDHTMEQDLLAYRVPILAVGDYAQLPPVNGVSTWMRRPNVRLEHPHRQALGSPIIRLATFVREKKRLPLDLDEYDCNSYLKFSFAWPTLQEKYVTVGKENTVVLSFTNNNRVKINNTILEKLTNSTDVAVGGQVICLRNANDIGIFNGDRGILVDTLRDIGHDYIGNIEFDYGDKSTNVKINKEQFGLPKTLDLSHGNKSVLFDHGYATTCHKFQGSSSKEVFILKDMPSSFDEYEKWMYTAITRATDKVHFVSRL